MLFAQRGPLKVILVCILKAQRKLGICRIVFISQFQAKCTFLLGFADIRSPLLADNFLFYSYIFNINFLYFLAKNIYFALKCTGQPEAS